MNQLTELLMYKALSFKQSSQECSDTILDHLTSNGHEAADKIEQKLELKNVCAKVSGQLAERLDNTCNTLSVSKRRFIESAIIYALDEADRIVSEVNMFEHIEQQEAK